MVTLLTIGLFHVCQHMEWNITPEHCFTIVFSFCTIVFAIVEYTRKLDSDRNQLMMDYNKRFITNSEIQSVIRFLQRFDGQKTIPEAVAEKPGKSEIFLFARFFEELQVSRKVYGFDEKTVCRLYAYYAIEAYHKKLIDNVDDDESWRVFRDFCNEMEDIECILGIYHD